MFASFVGILVNAKTKNANISAKELSNVKITLYCYFKTVLSSASSTVQQTIDTPCIYKYKEQMEEDIGFAVSVVATVIPCLQG